MLAHPSGAYVANLDGDWETFYAAKRSSSTRKRERRQLKHLAEFGEVRFVDVQDSQDIERTLETLISQKSRSFARMGVDDLFARPGYREFFLDVATDLNVRALTHVSRLDVGATPPPPISACVSATATTSCSRATTTASFRAFGPGRAPARVASATPSTAGFSASISPSATSPTSATGPIPSCGCMTIWRRPRSAARLMVAMTGAYRRAKRFIKQSPTLWHAFSKARVLAGSLSPR